MKDAEEKTEMAPGAAVHQSAPGARDHQSGFERDRSGHDSDRASAASRRAAADLALAKDGPITLTEVAKSAVERLKKKLDQKAAQRTEQEQADEIDQARRAVREPDPDEIDPGVAADLEAAGESRSIRDPKGLFVMGNPGGPGRPPGSKDSFPRNSYRAMRELIAGRIMKAMKDEEGKDVQRSAAEIMAEVILEGMLGNLVLSQTDKSTTYANPLHAVKLYQDDMLKARE